MNDPVQRDYDRLALLAVKAAAERGRNPDAQPDLRTIAQMTHHLTNIRNSVDSAQLARFADAPLGPITLKPR